MRLWWNCTDSIVAPVFLAVRRLHVHVFLGIWLYTRSYTSIENYYYTERLYWNSTWSVWNSPYMYMYMFFGKFLLLYRILVHCTCIHFGHQFIRTCAVFKPYMQYRPRNNIAQAAYSSNLVWIYFQWEEPYSPRKFASNHFVAIASCEL